MSVSLNNRGKDKPVEKAPVFERDGSKHLRSPPVVELVAVDEVVLSRLVEVATTDAAPDDVTPPLGDGWTPERVEWLRAFHRLRRAGLADGEEETSAIRVDGTIVGATRLHRSSPQTPDQLECGIWLARSSRNLGLSKTVLRLLASRAVAAGASRIVARTTAGNAAAVAILKRADARLHNGPDGAVHAVVHLDEIGVSSVATKRDGWTNVVSDDVSVTSGVTAGRRGRLR